MQGELFVLGIPDGNIAGIGNTEIFDDDVDVVEFFAFLACGDFETRVGIGPLEDGGGKIQDTGIGGHVNAEFLSRLADEADVSAVLGREKLDPVVGFGGTVVGGFLEGGNGRVSVVAFGQGGRDDPLEGRFVVEHIDDLVGRGEYFPAVLSDDAVLLLVDIGSEGSGIDDSRTVASIDADGGHLEHGTELGLSVEVGLESVGAETVGADRDLLSGNVDVDGRPAAVQYKGVAVVFRPGLLRLDGEGVVDHGIIGAEGVLRLQPCLGLEFDFNHSRIFSAGRGVVSSGCGDPGGVGRVLDADVAFRVTCLRGGDDDVVVGTVAGSDDRALGRLLLDLGLDAQGIGDEVDGIGQILDGAAAGEVEGLEAVFTAISRTTSSAMAPCS